jgi:hypothetical protein
VFVGRGEAGLEGCPASHDLRRQERAVRQVGACLVVINTITAFFDGAVSTGWPRWRRRQAPVFQRLAKVM